MTALKLNLVVYHTVHLVIIRLSCLINNRSIVRFIIEMGRHLFPNDKRGNKSEIQIDGMKGKKGGFTRHFVRHNLV